MTNVYNKQKNENDQIYQGLKSIINNQLQRTNKTGTAKNGIEQIMSTTSLPPPQTPRANR